MPDLTLEQLKALTEEFTKLKNLFESGASTTVVKDQLNALGSSFGSLTDAATQSASSLQQVNNQFTDLSRNNLGSGLESLRDKFREVKDNANLSAEAIGLMAAKTLMLTPLVTRRLPLPEAFQAIGKEAETSTSSIAKMLDTTLKLFSPDLAKSKFPGLGLATEMLQANAQRADFAKNFESSFLMGAAATGEFSEALEHLGTDFSGLNLKTDAFSELVTQVGNTSGLSSTRVAEYANQIRQIPGALDNFNDQAGLVVEQMHFLDATIKTAVGTGQSFEQVMGDLTSIFNELGTKGKPALEIITQMQSTSDVIGLPLQRMREFTLEAARSFKFLGDNAQGAISIMGELGPSLQKSGLGPAAIQQLVQGVTSGISQMNTAQKAFLSAQTGGPTGLQGAFQVDLLLRQGKLDEVFGKVQQNLKQQLGGPIVTLEQAAKDATAAAQFQRQIALVKSPAMGGIAKSDAEAMRILEALAAKERGGPVAEQKSPEEAFADALSTGEKLQDRQNNLLIQANNWAERSAQIQSIIAYNTARQLGQEGPTSFANFLTDLKIQSSQAARELKPLTGQGMAGGQTVDDRLREAYTTGTDVLQNIQQKFTGFMQGQATQLVDSVKTTLTGPAQPAAPPKLEIPAPVSSNQFAFQNLPTQETPNVAQPGRVGQGAVANSIAQPQVDLAITTVCNVCQKEIATKAAKEAVIHYHNAAEQSNFHNQQSVF